MKTGVRLRAEIFFWYILRRIYHFGSKLIKHKDNTSVVLDMKRVWKRNREEHFTEVLFAGIKIAA